MSTLLADVRLRPLTVPASMHAADAADFAAMVDVRNRVYEQISGHADHSITAPELLPNFQDTEDEERFMWLVEADGALVGRVGVDLPRERGSRTAYWLIELLREAWGRGIGSHAYELVERTAREHGRTVLQAWAEQPATGEGEVLAPPTGFGEVPLDHIARFFLRHGYTLEQVERASALDLTRPLDRVEQLHAEAQAAAKDYRVVQWHAPTPPEFVEGYAWMKSRMSTDVPAGALEFDEETWDAARVERHDRRYLDGGRALQVTAAQHIATGELCAFNELVIGQDPTAASHQEDTLVLKEHRGHRLGMLVKCAGLLSWRGLHPRSPRVMTYNAEENRPMLDINEAIGFVPISYEGAWKKTLQE
ncbi:GNAT family N-acetyltransferase [Microbacterium sp. zg.Y1090]|uniref:GNAT family N-acetyltransferase n=1 Tax=Microbacterium TaxID=33882 RepID=UPI00214AB05D|nr:MULTISPECIES: GNAT family N-acetyltransferase [unclassified Microbacterium]MCR2811624.1 GNAT family N-acetyltransferase [Microbacterium sp. zg.Y1084]MCR2818954.1 GNAT family N-acetyltransferase [Microbacterium sp. zg.Y1090]MDL5487604.1 GNAT family N-acetyltransferase [Microbacterium sp. zg-Y1211]WIM27260.1 GNAT family N-acetyltransferase [Microbacterium sp. zg-Y1090]